MGKVWSTWTSWDIWTSGGAEHAKLDETNMPPPTVVFHPLREENHLLQVQLFVFEAVRNTDIQHH